MEVLFKDVLQSCWALCCFNEVQCARNEQEILMSKKWGPGFGMSCWGTRVTTGIQQRTFKSHCPVQELVLSQTAIRGIVTGVNSRLSKHKVCLQLYESHAL